MKRICIFFVLSFLSLQVFAQNNASISDDPAHSPDPSAMLDVHSLQKGMLTPRMSMAARNLIPAPATGLLIYQLDNEAGFYYYDGGAWLPVNAPDSDTDPTNELQSWTTLPDIPAAFADGVDDTGDDDWTVAGASIYRATGDVGIGTSTPNSSLHIKQPSTAIGDGIHLETSLNTAEDWYQYMNANDDLIFRNDALDVVALQKNTGNVGIGTTAPDAKLHVSGSFKVMDGNQAAGKVLTSDATGLATWQDAVANDADWTIAGADLYRASGDVGIGTTTPGASLHIKQAGTSIGDGIRLETSLGTSEDWYTYMDANDDYVIRNDGSNYFFIQKNTGNVVLGNSINALAAGYRLSVDGKVAVEEILIDDSAFWPDYVFAEDYDLLSIDEFAASIEKNKHLPGIPSAAEVEEKGIFVGDMQKRTMEKVEELSLYIIQLHERVKTLEEENTSLKAKAKSKKARINR